MHGSIRHQPITHSVPCHTKNSWHNLAGLAALCNRYLSLNQLPSFGTVNNFLKAASKRKAEDIEKPTIPHLAEMQPLIVTWVFFTLNGLTLGLGPVFSIVGGQKYREHLPIWY